jgi:chromosome segregation ATPase
MALTNEDKKYLAALINPLDHRLRNVEKRLGNVERDTSEIKKNMTTKADMQWLAKTINDGIGKHLDRHENKLETFAERISDLEDDVNKIKRHLSIA